MCTCLQMMCYFLNNHESHTFCNLQEQSLERILPCMVLRLLEFCPYRGEPMVQKGKRTNDLNSVKAKNMAELQSIM